MEHLVTVGIKMKMFHGASGYNWKKNHGASGYNWNKMKMFHGTSGYNWKKMKNTKYRTVRTVTKSNRKILETEVRYF